MVIDSSDAVGAVQTAAAKQGTPRMRTKKDGKEGGTLQKTYTAVLHEHEHALFVFGFHFLLNILLRVACPYAHKTREREC
jgi:hypothetical protein